LETKGSKEKQINSLLEPSVAGRSRFQTISAERERLCSPGESYLAALTESRALLWGAVPVATLVYGIEQLFQTHWLIGAGVTVLSLIALFVLDRLMRDTTTPPAVTTRRQLILVAALALVTWIGVVYDILDRHLHHHGVVISSYQIPTPLQGTGAPDSLCNFMVNGPAVSKLAALPGSPRNPVVIALCGFDNPSVDIYQDEEITVSKPYTFRPDVFLISVPYSGRMATALGNYAKHLSLPKRMVPKGATPVVQAYLWFQLALVPNNISLDSIRSLSDVKREGGKLLLEVPNRELAEFPIPFGKSK
jgi:hypothetical protein